MAAFEAVAALWSAQQSLADLCVEMVNKGSKERHRDKKEAKML